MTLVEDISIHDSRVTGAKLFLILTYILVGQIIRLYRRFSGHAINFGIDRARSLKTSVVGKNGLTGKGPWSILRGWVLKTICKVPRALVAICSICVTRSEDN